MITIFSAYVSPQIKEIHHPVLLQECKLNLDYAEYEKNMKANMQNSSEKRKFNRVDSDDQWPTSIKNTIQWFNFLTIMEHTENKMQENKEVISSLIKMFLIFPNMLEFWRRRFGRFVYKV